MRLSLLMLVLVPVLVSCAGQMTPEKSQGSAKSVGAPAPQRAAWQIYQRVTRGEPIPVSDIERELGPGAPVSPSRADRQWSFRDSDDVLVVTLDAQGRSTGAYWGLARGAHAGGASSVPSASAK